METIICPSFLASGRCTLLQCTLNHTNCILCQATGLTRDALWEHLGTVSHKKNERTYLETKWHCPTCNVDMKLKSRKRHEGLKSHRKKLAKLSARVPPPIAYQPVLNQPFGFFRSQPVVPEPRSTYIPTYKCKECQIRVPQPQWEQHLLDPSHARKARLAAYSQALEEGTKDKFGINIVQTELDFGIIDLSTLSTWPTRENVFYLRLEEGEIRLNNIYMTSHLGSQASFRDQK